MVIEITHRNYHRPSIAGYRPMENSRQYSDCSSYNTNTTEKSEEEISSQVVLVIHQF